MIVGSGIAGMAAALFAVRHGIDAVQVGITGEINFASGLIDLMGVHPLAKGRLWTDPWAAIDCLTRDMPQHPYAKISPAVIRKALTEFTDFLAAAGQPYHFHPRRNTRVMTPAGTCKTTYAVPISMTKGAKALAKRSACLLIDFEGLKGYSARQMTEMLKDQWPKLRCQRIGFPGVTGEAYPEHLARFMEVAATRQALAEAVGPYIGDAEAVGFPAIMGIYRIPEILADLEHRLGVDLFEVPTMPPSITGLRMREAFEERLPQLGVQTFYQQRVLAAEISGNGTFRFQIGPQAPETTVEAKAALLASGRFFGRGLIAERSKIREAIFDLPVFQPAQREQWHHKHLFDSRGHAVNQSGLVIDEEFRPLVTDGRPYHSSLFATGSILAHQDWIRQKCGSGLAISTALAAIRAYMKTR
jgi:glycerol-3-phosphate dehydrogenase subunit B